MADVIDFGKVAYDGYVDYLFMKDNIIHHDIYNDLPESIKQGWRAAAKAVMEKNSVRT
jgi:hypothetical protein